jgi:hypothetical protein
MSEDIEAAIRTTGRSCGECSLCCKLPPIDTPELQKPANTWCPHCRPGKGGCGIYETRPTLCRNYRCLWLKDATLGEEWKPSHCRMYLHFTSAGLVVVVDPGYPEQWRKSPYYATLKLYAQHNRDCKRGVAVMVGERRFAILADEDIEMTGTISRHVKLMADGTFADMTSEE